jgi:hypothetical protein
VVQNFLTARCAQDAKDAKFCLNRVSGLEEPAAYGSGKDVHFKEIPNLSSPKASPHLAGLTG